MAVIATVGIVVVLARWTDSRGWTRFRGNERASAATVFNAFDQVLNSQRKAAVEYRMEEQRGQHGESDAAGDHKH